MWHSQWSYMRYMLYVTSCLISFTRQQTPSDSSPSTISAYKGRNDRDRTLNRLMQRERSPGAWDFDRAVCKSSLVRFPEMTVSSTYKTQFGFNNHSSIIGKSGSQSERCDRIYFDCFLADNEMAVFKSATSSGNVSWVGQRNLSVRHVMICADPVLGRYQRGI
jgi:hypothetical protein